MKKAAFEGRGLGGRVGSRDGVDDGEVDRESFGAGPFITCEFFKEIFRSGS